MTSLEAYDLIVHADQLQERLWIALGDLEKRSGLKREKGWLLAAAEMLPEAQGGHSVLLERVIRLPELREVREDHAGVLQGQWVDSLERLLAGITFHAGSRAPIIEALFPKAKLPILRRAKREAVQQFQADLDRRLNGTYVKRMLVTDTFAFAPPVIEQISAAFAQWELSFSGESASDEEARQLRAELIEVADALVQPTMQAKLLAEAALLPLQGAYDASGINAKLRKRTGRSEGDLDVASFDDASEVQEVESSPVEDDSTVEALPPKRKSAKEKLATESVPSPASEVDAVSLAPSEDRPKKAARRGRKALATEDAGTPPPPAETLPGSAESILEAVEVAAHAVLLEDAASPVTRA